MSSTDTYEDRLAHERELLRIPEVAVVDSTHQDICEDDTNVLVELQPERRVQAAGSDEVPVEGPGQQAHALVVASATEHIAEDGAVIVGQTEDRHTGKYRENPCDTTTTTIVSSGSQRHERIECTHTAG